MSPPLRIGLCQGEPGGCGPDLWTAVLHQLNQAELGAEFVYIGDTDLLQRRAEQLGQPVKIEAAGLSADATPRSLGHCGALHLPLPQPERTGTVEPAHQAQVLDCLNQGARWCETGALDAICTAPVHKAAIRQAGFDFVGQTEWLAAQAGGCRPLMSFIAGEFRVALATTHLPLAQVPAALSTDGLLEDLRTLDAQLRRLFDLSQPRLMVCGLNPHAGEQGELGSEEQDIIAPAIARAQRENIAAFGPVAADTAFAPDTLKKADAVLGMYHDQVLPLLKHKFFDEAVNLTLGLPFVRTSPDHGTALDIAGSGRVRPHSTLAAIDLAVQLARRSKPATVPWQQQAGK